MFEIGGILSSTALMLLVLPVLYTAHDRDNFDKRTWTEYLTDDQGEMRSCLTVLPILWRSSVRNVAPSEYPTRRQSHPRSHQSSSGSAPHVLCQYPESMRVAFFPLCSVGARKVFSRSFPPPWQHQRAKSPAPGSGGPIAQTVPPGGPRARDRPEAKKWTVTSVIQLAGYK